jgi:6-pyruvoyltetrahydropterin/6-carboxytetrahydropterin synthase
VIALTRRYEFSAAHVLRHPSFSEAENHRVYGRCANPRGHGHNYRVEVTVTGPVDEGTGRIIAPELLDQIFEERVRTRFAHRLLNDDAIFSRLVPTAENIATVIHAGLSESVAERSSARVLAVRVVETSRNSCTYGELP